MKHKASNLKEKQDHVEPSVLRDEFPSYPSVGGGKVLSASRGKTVINKIIFGQIPNLPDSSALSPSELVEIVHEGLPMAELEHLRSQLNLSIERLAGKIGISKATLHRRKQADSRLTPDETDKVIRFARLLGKAIATLENENDARLWLNSPQVGLNGAIPLDYAETEIGAREVEDLLNRIEYGVYS